MLHYEDLPPLVGTPEEVKRATIVRFACLHTIQNTQRVLMQEVGLGKRSPQVYHRQTAALQLTMSLYRHASWWLAPFPFLEHDFRLTWGRIMAAPYRIVEGHSRFVFAEREHDFAQRLAPLAPHLICQEVSCVLCGQKMVRTHLRSVWEPDWCGWCMPTELVLPITDAEDRVLVTA